MFKKQSAFSRVGFSCSPSFCINRKRFLLVWILPWIVAISFGIFFVSSFTKRPEQSTFKEEPFDWVDVEWDFSSPKVSEPKRLTPKFYGFLIDPVRDSYLYPPQSVKTSYSIVKNCIFDTNGYYIKDKTRYPSQHKWLIPQYEIEEDDPIEHNVTKCICLFVPRSFSAQQIAINIMPRLLALPAQDLATLPIFTNSANEYIFTILKWAGLSNLNITLMKGAVFAKEMYVLDYPEPNTFHYQDFAAFKELIHNSIGYNEPVNQKINIDMQADIRLTNYSDLLKYYMELDGSIESKSLFISSDDLPRFFGHQRCFVSFGSQNLAYAIFMRPNTKLVLFTNMLDIHEGAKMAQYAGVQVSIIGSRNRTLTPKVTEYVFKVIKKECSDTHTSSDDDEETALNLDDIDDPTGVQEIIAKQQKIMSKIKSSGNTDPSFNKPLQKELITGDKLDNDE